jgi:hypothetical protein
MSPFQQLFGSPEIAAFNPHSRKVFANLHKCHTAAKGYHLYRCNKADCNQEKVQFHSCGDRHCPHCGTMRKEAWIEDRQNELLPTAYYHVVFTLPHEFNPLILGNRTEMFKVLFAAAAETLLNYGKNAEFLGATPGITMILHTWGQNLSFHPHLHCIVSGGGYNPENKKWIPAKRIKNNFIFPVAGLSTMFKAIFLKRVRQHKNLKTKDINLEKVIETTGFKRWNVYAKPPFGDVAAVTEYLGRYTHKIAITKHRILEVTDTTVRFRYKDYADGNQTKEMTLTRAEFLRRFEQHILPRGFVKIRHYGYLQNKGKYERLGEIRKALELSPLRPKVQIPVAVRLMTLYGTDVSQCPCCKDGKLELIQVFYPPRESRNKASPAAVDLNARA